MKNLAAPLSSPLLVQVNRSPSAQRMKTKSINDISESRIDEEETMKNSQNKCLEGDLARTRSKKGSTDLLFQPFLQNSQLGSSSNAKESPTGKPRVIQIENGGQKLMERGLLNISAKSQCSKWQNQELRENSTENFEKTQHIEKSSQGDTNLKSKLLLLSQSIQEISSLGSLSSFPVKEIEEIQKKKKLLKKKIETEGIASNPNGDLIKTMPRFELKWNTNSTPKESPKNQKIERVLDFRFAQFEGEIDWTQKHQLDSSCSKKSVYPSL
jgi:hypothetical protein